MIPWGIIAVAAMRGANGGAGKGRTTVWNERAVAIACWLFVFPALIGVVVAMFFSDLFGIQALGGFSALALLVVMFPWPIARFLCIPRGWVNAATHVTRLSLWVWGGDREGGAICAGAMAVARMRVDDVLGRKKKLAWLDGFVAKAKLGHTALLLAQSLLARLRAEHDRADRLLEAVTLMPAEITPFYARALAGEAVVAAALARGDIATAAKTRCEGTAQAALLSACAQALSPWEKPKIGHVSSSLLRLRRTTLRARIVWLSLRCWPRGPWRRLVADAHAALRSKIVVDDAPEASTPSPTSVLALDAPDVDGLSSMQAAVLLTAHARRAGNTIGTDEIVELGAVVDDAAFRVAHAIDGDVSLVDAASDALSDVMRDVTASWSKDQKAQASLSPADGSTKNLDALYDVVERIPRNELLPAAAEVEEWARLRGLYEGALVECGDDKAMAPWEAIRDPLWNHSARIFNKGQKGLGRAMFAFLLAEAGKRGDEPCVKGMRQNLRAA